MSRLNINHMLKRISFWIKFFFFTQRTPKWLRQAFFKICNMDTDKPIEIGSGSISGKCLTVSMYDDLSEQFYWIHYSQATDEIYAFSKSHYADPIEVYRDYKVFKDANWMLCLKKYYNHLVWSGEFAIQARRQLNEMGQLL